MRAASAPADDNADGALRLHAFTLRHQPAGEAVALVAPLLSKRGTVELQPGTNTLLVRDVLSAITRIVPVLAAFDHPARAVTLDLQLIEASAATASGGGGRLPAELLVRLRKLLPYKGYAPVAGAEFATQEGEEVTYDLAGRFRVAFRVGSLVDGRRLRIHGFSIQRLPDTGDELIHTNLNLSLGQSMVLVLAREEDSPRALMVALEARLGVAPISPPSGAP